MSSKFLADKHLNRKMKKLSFNDLVRLQEHYDERKMRNDMKESAKLADMDKIMTEVISGKWRKIC